MPGLECIKYEFDCLDTQLLAVRPHDYAQFSNNRNIISSLKSKEEHLDSESESKKRFMWPALALNRCSAATQHPIGAVFLILLGLSE